MDQTSTPVQVLIADDHILLRDALASVEARLSETEADARAEIASYEERLASLEEKRAHDKKQREMFR